MPSKQPIKTNPTINENFFIPVSPEQRLFYHSLTKEQKHAFVSALSPSAFEQFRFFSDIHLRQEQVYPDSFMGRYYLAACGRGWGKTKMGAWAIQRRVYGQQKGLAIVCPTFKDLEDNMVPAILEEFPSRHKPKYIGGNKCHILCHNGVKILCFTSETEIRGGNFSFVWCDELAKWCQNQPLKARECFQILDFACRKGKAQFLITTTPKQWPIFFDWKKRFLLGDPLIHVVSGTMYDNVDLSPQAVKALEQEHKGSRLGRQELMGELLEDNPNALWNEALLRRAHISQLEFDNMLKSEGFSIKRTVVTVDPAVSNNPYSDETGIAVQQLGSDNKVYVVRDLSGRHSPDSWAQAAVNAYHQFNAAHIVLEANQGGALLEQNIKTVDRYARTQLIHASVGKQTRFEPVVAAYERGEVYHVGNLDALEAQMLSYNPYLPIGGQSSPDRVDAVAYGVYYLLLGQEKPVYRSIRNLGAW